MLNQALALKIVRTFSHDEFRRRADECRRLAATARDVKDRAFWLGLVERWQALESHSVQPLASTPPEAEEGGQSTARRRSGTVDATRSRLTETPPLQSSAPAASGRAAGPRSKSAKRKVL